MRYTEVDGKRLEIECCSQCPFLNEEVGCAHECRYPNLEKPIDLEGTDLHKEVPSGCPLRMKTAKEPGLSQHLAQCPYCYGRSMLVHYVCDGPSCTFDTYRVECTECGASTLDHNAKTVKLMWELGQIGKRVGKHR